MKVTDKAVAEAADGAAEAQRRAALVEAELGRARARVREREERLRLREQRVVVQLDDKELFKVGRVAELAHLEPDLRGVGAGRWVVCP